MGVAAAWWTRLRRLCRADSGQLLGYLWLGALGGALLLSAQYAYQRSLSVEEYAFACDPFGYLGWPGRSAKPLPSAICRNFISTRHRRGC